MLRNRTIKKNKRFIGGFMGDISVIARRLSDGHVQYGWSGNGGYYSMVGDRLMAWYNKPEDIEYLFGLGQMELIGAPGSEKGGFSFMYTHKTTGKPHWLGMGENEVFSKIAFIDYVYFYDLDGKWYYIDPEIFAIKTPLEYISKHLDGSGYEFDERKRIQRNLSEYILGEYYTSEEDFQSFILENYPCGIDQIMLDIFSTEKKGIDAYYNLVEKYRGIVDYFDRWVVVKTSEDYSEITGFIIKKRQQHPRVETIDWK